MTRPEKLGLGAALLTFSALAVRLALRAPFTVDEFQYAHASWLVSKGAVPYRDFFEVHLPLVYQWLAPMWRLLGDDPAGVVWLRVGLLPFLALTALAAVSINRREGWVAAGLSPVLLLACPGFVGFATQIRPDPVAFALFLAALGVRYAQRPGPLARGFACGALTVFAAWGSQKVLFYGAPLLLGLLPVSAAEFPKWSDHRTSSADKKPNWSDHRTKLPSALGFLAGAVVALVPIAAYLSLTHSFAALFHWCFAWAAEHERGYPGFSAHRYLDPAVAQAPWLFALGALGAAATARRWATSGPSRWSDPDLMLLLSLPAAFGSFALQRAPYPYSLLPLLGVTAVLAARGVAALLRVLSPLGLERVGGTAVALLLAAQAVRVFHSGTETNAHQREVLARIGELTAPADAAYDNSGGYVARPHAFFYFYTDAFLRTSSAEALARDVPEALIASECVLRVEDVRSDTLPASLRDFLAAHYQPLDGDLSLWGQRFDAPGEARFQAVKAGRYFVEPESAASGLEVDGRKLESSIVELTRGLHPVRSAGPSPFYLLWLPRDGQRWVPHPGLAPTYSRLF